MLRRALQASWIASAALVGCTPPAAEGPRDARVTTFATLPDWRGYWITEGFASDISGYAPIDPAASINLVFSPGPWRPGRAPEPPQPGTVARKSQGWGYPMMMNSSAPLQFLVTPEETLIVNSYRDIRHVYTDGRTLPAAEDRWPSVWGESVGRWEGDTLVVDTVSVAEPMKYMFFAPTFTGNAAYEERLRRVGPDRMEMQITITDPETLTQPWVVKLVYVRAPGLDRMLHDAYVNDRSELDGNEFTILPPQ